MNYPRNIFLEDLNSQANISLLKQRVEVTNIISDLGSESTLNFLRVIPDPNLNDNKWQNGYPENLDRNFESLEKGSGDKTVPFVSANSLNNVEVIETNSSDHKNLPTAMQEEIIKSLTGKTPDNFYNSKITLTIKKWFFLRVYSPVDFVVIAPDGKRVGKDFNNNAEVNEIPDAFYSGFNNEAEFVLIPNPEEGQYEVKIQGVDGGGEYTLASSYINEDDEDSVEFSGIASQSAEKTFEINFSPESENPVSEIEPIVSPDIVIADIQKLYQMGMITDRVIAKQLEREIEDIKWRLKLLNDSIIRIYKQIEKISASNQPEKVKMKMILRYNEEIDRLKKENDKQLNFIYNRLDKNLAKYLKRGLINQDAYDIIIDDIKYLINN